MVKKTDIYDQQKQRFWQELERAPTLQEKYSSLNSIEVSFCFEDWDSGKLSEPKKEIYGPNRKAFFKFECPHYECISGGFNISDSISKMIQNSESETSGECVCQGWQDRERINKHRCMLKMKFKAMANYKS